MKRSVGFAMMLLLGLCHLASADPTIKPGIDVFRTIGGGKTSYDFVKTPVPAGFFCDSSSSFTGRVALKGLPVETAAPGQLGNTDTIIERLDEAVFNAQGVAETRIRFRALSMVSVAPIKTSCGAFHVYVTLDGKQPVTRMRIQRSHPDGGSFRAPLSANVRLTFVPVRGRNPRKLELKGSVSFPGKPIPWTIPDGEVLKPTGSAIVDTNGDLRPDTRLPGTSNFTAGIPPKGFGPIGTTEPGCYCVCHADESEYHCTGTGGFGCSYEINCYQ